MLKANKRSPRPTIITGQHGRETEKLQMATSDKSQRHLIGPSMIHSFPFFFHLQILSKKEPKQQEEDETRTQQSWQRVKAIKLSQESEKVKK